MIPACWRETEIVSTKHSEKEGRDLGVWGMNTRLRRHKTAIMNTQQTTWSMHVDPVDSWLSNRGREAVVIREGQGRIHRTTVETNQVS